MRVSGQQQQLRQFPAGRSRALGDVEDDDLLLPQSRVLLRVVERWPWPPDARAPPTKDTPASIPPPRHPHLVGDLHTFHLVPAPPFVPRPSALQPDRFGRLASKAEERSSLPRASSAPANQQADPASFSLRHECTLAAFLGSGGADACGDASPLPWLLRRGRRRQAAALARRWRTQMDKRLLCSVVKQFN